MAEEKRFHGRVCIEFVDKASGEVFWENTAKWGSLGIADVQGIETAYLGFAQVLLDQSFKDTDGKPEFVADAKSK